ncbi:MAG TPA: DUF177 domain-containing protein [Pseudolabrys sp.]|nr:DUF177 domain-containing protein [Pseudolabrys sp.]
MFVLKAKVARQKTETMQKNQTAWSVPVAVDEIPDTGLHVEIDAPDTIRAQLAGLAGLRELSRLSGVFDLVRQGASVRVSGQVNARVGQTCVVTLEPIESEVQEFVDLKFASSLAVEHTSEVGEEDPPESLSDGKVDLGAIAIEFLLLGIDPYPRKPGAEFSPLKSEDGSAKPFAALEALKKRLSGG